METTTAAKNIRKINRVKLFRKNKAFNLIELILSISLLTLFLTFSLFNYQKNLQKREIKLITNNLITSLTYAKHYALYNACEVYFCLTKDLKHCAYDSKNNFNINGFMIFSEEKILKTLKFNLKNEIKFSLFAFGYANNILKIQSDGTTYKNGRIELTSIEKKNNNNLNKTKIIWNTNLRIYTKEHV